jgi:hypothetical protein
MIFELLLKANSPTTIWGEFLNILPEFLPIEIIRLEKAEVRGSIQGMNREDTDITLVAKVHTTSIRHDR